MKKGTLLFIFALAATISSTLAQPVSIDVARSSVKWSAKKVVGEHSGAISIKSGTLTLNNKNIASGAFVVDMKTISVSDLPAGEWNDKLVGHLNSDDFFATDKFPESNLLILSATAFNEQGSCTVKGNLTIKGITLPTEFETKISDKGYKTTLIIDRTKYNIKYGSGQFFEGLGDKMIMDNFELEITIATK